MKIIEGAGLRRSGEGHRRQEGGSGSGQREEQKKLAKGFPDLKFDANNACVLPPDAENKLVDIIGQMKVLDVMKVAIMSSTAPWPERRRAPLSAKRFSLHISHSTIANASPLQGVGRSSFQSGHSFLNLLKSL